MYTPPKVKVVQHYIDDIILIRWNEQEVTSKLEALVKHVSYKGWKINPVKIQGIATLVKYIGIQWSRVDLDILSKDKEKSLHSQSHSNKSSVVPGMPLWILGVRIAGNTESGQLCVGPGIGKGTSGIQAVVPAGLPHSLRVCQVLWHFKCNWWEKTY